MADLIIKPATGSGNKLIFKDQAGNSIITTADSGGTIDSGVTWTSPVINTGISGTAILDEDAMGSDSATKLATQQSIKAYADTKAPIAGPTFTGTVAIPNVANLETAVVANTAKVTNATHTGDVTGATALTIAAGAVDIAMLASGTDGELITWDASGDPAVVAVGTSGHVLTSGGTGVAPTFQAAAGFPTGTKMIFNQTAAPTGWTKVTGSGNDSALRVTTGTVGTGGSVAFETAFASQTVPAHTLTTAEIPAHTHTMDLWASNWQDDGKISGQNASEHQQPDGTTDSTGSGGSHGHGSIDLNVSYVDVIIATKD